LPLVTGEKIPFDSRELDQRWAIFVLWRATGQEGWISDEG
jgi:hypothetical protein